MSFLMSNILTSCDNDSTFKGAAKGQTTDNAQAQRPQRSVQMPKLAALKNGRRRGARKTTSREKGQKSDCNGFDTRFQGNNPCARKTRSWFSQSASPGGNRKLSFRTGENQAIFLFCSQRILCSRNFAGGS